MTVTITENSRYRHLNSDKSHRIKVGGAGMEKEMVVDIAVSAEDLSDATVGGFIVDFTTVGFKQVYDCQITQQDNFTDLFFFIEGSDIENASTGAIQVKQMSDATDQNSGSYTVNLTAIIRGI